MAILYKYYSNLSLCVLKIPKNNSSTFSGALENTFLIDVYSSAIWSVLEIFLGILSTNLEAFEHYLFAFSKRRETKSIHVTYSTRLMLGFG